MLGQLDVLGWQEPLLQFVGLQQFDNRMHELQKLAKEVFSLQ